MIEARPEGLWIGKCHACGAAQASRQAVTSLPCPACGERIELVAVQGRFVPSHACDAACEHATGFKCECVCGGANHGCGFLGWEFVPEVVKAKLRRSHEQIVARREAKIAAKASKVAEIIEAHPALAIEPGSSDSYFVNDVIGKLHENGALSEAQISAVERAIVGEAARKVRQAEWAARDAAEVKVAVTDGRREIVGTILALKEVENDYGTTEKMLVQCDGFKVFGTAPNALYVSADQNVNMFPVRGDVVRFTGTFEGKEIGFGFFSRPAKGSYVSKAVVAA